MSVVYSYVVIGGGIAGVTCVETIASTCPDEKILLLSSSSIVKSVINFKQLTRALENFEVTEKASTDLTAEFPSIAVVHNHVIRLNSDRKEVETVDGRIYHYDKLCLCTGGSPKLIAENNEYVLGIRDTETVLAFEERLSNARRILVVGNGGIATELVYKIKSCDVIWAIKDESIIGTFVDAGAARFLLPHVTKEKQEPEGPLKRRKYHLEEDSSSCLHKATSHGCALGPDWIDALTAKGLKKDKDKRFLHVEYKVEVKELLTPDQVTERRLVTSAVPSDDGENLAGFDWPVYVHLTNGKLFGCDFVVSATGVTPCVGAFLDEDNKFEIAEDGGIKVNSHMQTSVPGVFAAGDVCNASWEHSPYWLQMRLWDQARQMGHYAATCMIAEATGQLNQLAMDFCFELFAHVTKFFDYKVVLLGRFNGQGLDDDYKLLIRVTEGEQYVKAVMRNGRLVGAVLVGETDLEETFENLILNQLDLSRYGDELLYQDIEDFFD